jgi:hypothetical protein
MEQLREELLDSNPVEMRRRANAVLGQILAKRLDPRYRRTALDVLKRLDDDQERAAARADREGGAAKRMRSTSAQPPVDLDQLINEIAQIAERRHSRELEPPLMPVLGARKDDPWQAAREATQLLEEVVGERPRVVGGEPTSAIVKVEEADGTPLPADSAEETSEGEDLKALDPPRGENTAETEVAPGPAPEVKFDLVPIPGYFPPRFRRVQRRG